MDFRNQQIQEVAIKARTLNLLSRKKLWIALTNPTLVVLEKQLQLVTIMLSPVIGERPS